MVKINGEAFHDEPRSCGSCPFMPSFHSRLEIPDKRGHCLLFDEWHLRYRNIPARCHKLFKKALTFPEGTDLSIVKS